jgi:hypothetical protein
MLDYAFTKFDIEETKSLTKISQKERNDLALRFLKVNDILSRKCKIERKVLIE